MIRFILLFLLFIFFYYIIKFIINFLIPVLRGRSEYTSYNNTGYGKSKKEGEVSIDFRPENKKKYKKDAGEYVDYKEVE
ncbi:hypothetical protein ACFLTE_02405 [Bacteroidota bacterium]